MAISQQIMNEIMSGYDQRREAALQRQKEDTARVYARIPELSQIEGQIEAFGLRAMKAYLSNGRDSKAAVAELKKEQEHLLDRKKQLLMEHGLPWDYLEVRYTCPLCKDTGYIEGRKCSCLEQAILDRVYDQSGIRRSLVQENFDSFNLELFSPHLVPGKKMSPKTNMKEIVRNIRAYVNGFEEYKDANILFSGETGTGKSFLSHCVARALLDQGYQVLYITAYDLCATLSDYRYSYAKENMEAKIHMIYDCDLLIIDDLGTEHPNTGSVAELFHCINQRIADGKGMLISTNLSVDKLSEAYGDRLGSRLSSLFEVFQFYGPDLRMAKRRFGKI